VSVFSICFDVLSEETDSLNKEGKDVEKIVVTLARDEQALFSTNRALSVIEQGTINLENHQHVQQLLNQFPGIYFHRNSGQEYLVAIRSPVTTGAGACGEFLMLENGIPVRPAGMCNVNELFETHHQVAQTIELLRGPSSSVYGANGLHGVVNILTPQLPEDSGSTKLTVGSLDYLKLNQINQFGNLSSAVTLIDDGGFRESSGVSQQMWSAKHVYDHSNFQITSFATLFNLDQNSAGYLTGRDAYKDEKQLTTNPNPEAYRKASGFRLYQHYQIDEGWKISPYIRYSHMEFMQHFLPGKPIEKNGQTSIGVQTSKQYQVSTDFEITYGVDAEYANINLNENQAEATTGSAFLQATIPIGKHYDYQVDSKNVAVFVTSKMKLNELWALQAGLRGEYLHFNYDNLMLSGRTDENGVNCGFGGCRYSRPSDRTDEFLQWSPQLGLTYSASSNSQWYWSYIHGFRAPQATELYRLQRQQEVAELNPVRLNGVDAGWRYRGSDFAFSIGTYRYHKSNVIVRNTDFYNVGGGETSHQGIEMEAMYAFNSGYTIKANTSLSAHKYLNNPGISEQEIIGLDVDTAPRILGNVFVGYERSDIQWQLHIEHVGRYYTDVENAYTYPGHTLLHYKINIQLSDQMRLGFQINNVLDARYASRADYSSFAGQRYFPGQPRNINLSLSYQY
jgi:outer membrane receptor protein involved in Fe transport